MNILILDPPGRWIRDPAKTKFAGRRCGGKGAARDGAERVGLRERKKKGMVAHPRVLTQRTPVLRGGQIISSWRPSLQVQLSSPQPSLQVQLSSRHLSLLLP